MTLRKAWMENNTIRMCPHEFVVQDVIEGNSDNDFHVYAVLKGSRCVMEHSRSFKPYGNELISLCVQFKCN